MTRNSVLLMLLTGLNLKKLVFLPCKILKLKMENSLPGFFLLALFCFNRNTRRTNINADGGYCVITVQ